jgi:hypothetical protein
MVQLVRIWLLMETAIRFSPRDVKNQPRDHPHFLGLSFDSTGDDSRLALHGRSAWSPT